MAGVPRHLLVPDFWLHTGAFGEDERTGTHFTPATPGYLDAVYSDETLVTQFIEHDGWPWPTSSSTAPSLMLRMLRDLDVHDGMAILEVGTGTGYNAGLLSHRLGDSRVASIDIDPVLVESAGRRLKAAGFHPILAVRDGREGFPDAAPYDRLIATVAFERVPPAWLHQVRPGGVIVCDLRPPGAPWSGALAKLTVGEDRTASGRLLECQVGFMSARPRVAVPGLPGGAVIDRTTVHRRDTPLGGAVAMSPDLALVIWQRVPGLVVYSGDESITVIAGDSWAEVPQEGPTRLSYGGPDDIWAAVEAAHAWWQTFGRPGARRYGITVTPERQWIWVDDVDQPVA
ncbi:methyltransferase domain-containing protein [Streptosporangium saharense]|uniref:methyltransferase domain-containing protein n=1 Tax=Streptosporangium saharense TaxID=1706840 RepID=UPI0036B9EC68